MIRGTREKIKMDDYLKCNCFEVIGNPVPNKRRRVVRKVRKTWTYTPKRITQRGKKLKWL